MIPKIAACLHAVAGGVGSAHLLDGRLPARRAARALQRRRRRHHDHGGAAHDAHADAMGAPPLEHCPLMPTYGPPALQLVRGEGSWLWDKDGRRYLDLLSGLAVTGLGHSHPAVAAALARAGPDARCTCRTSSAPSRLAGGVHPRPAPRRRPARLADRGHTGPGVLRQLRRRGQRVRPQAGPQVRRPRPPRRRERVRLVPRAHAGHAARHRSARQARGVPAAARRASGTSPGTTSTRSRPPSTRRWPPCCSSRCRARAA